MKNLKIFALILLMLFSAVALTACSGSADLTAESTDSLTEASVQETASESGTEASQEQSADYSSDEDELEIMTVPDANSSSQSNTDSREESATQAQKETAQEETAQEETAQGDEEEEPTNRVIELPFVPVQ